MSYPPVQVSPRGWRMLQRHAELPAPMPPAATGGACGASPAGLPTIFFSPIRRHSCRQSQISQTCPVSPDALPAPRGAPECLTCVWSTWQYGVDVDGDGIADYMVTQGGYGYGSAAPGYAGYATTGYATTGYAEGYAEGGVTAPPNLPAGARSDFCQRLLQGMPWTVDSGIVKLESLAGIGFWALHRRRKSSRAQKMGSRAQNQMTTPKLLVLIVSCVFYPCRASFVCSCCLLSCVGVYRFQDTVQGANGSVIDRYVVPQRGTVVKFLTSLDLFALLVPLSFLPGPPFCIESCLFTIGTPTLTPIRQRVP